MQLTIGFEAAHDEGSFKVPDAAIAPPPTDPAAMRRAAFIESHRSSFVRYRGHRKIIGVQCKDGRILDLPPKSQKNGRLLRPVEEVLGDIHRAAVEAEVTSAFRWPNRQPRLPPDHVLNEYPDLARAVALGIEPKSLAAIDSQPTSYREIGAEFPRTLTDLKRQLQSGVAITRYSDIDPGPVHLVVRRVQTNAFVAGPVVLTAKYADGLWHHYQPAKCYVFGRAGFDARLKNDRTVSYRYGHLPLDQPCPPVG